MIDCGKFAELAFIIFPAICKAFDKQANQITFVKNKSAANYAESAINKGTLEVEIESFLDSIEQLLNSFDIDIKEELVDLILFQNINTEKFEDGK